MKREVAIVGAGIAGLCSALALVALGCRICVFEQTAEIEEIGAGLQLSPNATRILRKLGVTDDLASQWCDPEGLDLFSGDRLGRLTHIELGASARQRWNAPYAVVHRGVLQRSLLEKCRGSDNIRFEFGQRLDPTELKALSRDFDMLIGADGVWSSVREVVPKSGVPRFAHHVAWRAMASNKDTGKLVADDRISVLLGPRSHLVAYGIGPGQTNLVAVTPGSESRKEWDLAGQTEQLHRCFKGWHEAVHVAIDNAAWRCWPIYEVGGGAWQDGSNIVLAGDAAHAMPPHAAQGAAMAIEDADELANCMARSNGDVASAIAAYEARRKPRLKRIRRRGWLNRFAYQATGPVRIGRDVVFALRSPESLAADLDWIYGYDASAGSG